jgi:amino acid transporter
MSAADKVGPVVIGTVMALVFILNIVAISIMVVESKGTNTSPEAIATAEAGIGIAIAVTGIYGIWNYIKFKNPGRDYYGRLIDNSTYCLVTAVLMGILCILNVIAIAIVLITSDANQKQLDPIALQMAYAGVSITIIASFVYMCVNFSALGKSQNPNGIQTGYVAPPSGTSAADYEASLYKTNPFAPREPREPMTASQIAKAKQHGWMYGVN